MTIDIEEFNAGRRVKVKDRTGQRHGRLVAVSLEGINRESRSAIWRCICDCGNFIDISSQGFGSSGNTKSCGCLRSESGKRNPINWKVNISHGEAGNRRTTEYITWHSMIQRCTNKNHPSYHLYGGRGISVCNDWRISYESFLSDMGRRPSKNYSLDRINNDIGYEKNNCRWVTRTDQNNNKRNNRRVVFRGVEMTCAELAEKINIPYRTILNWANKISEDFDAFIDLKLAKIRAKESPR